MAKEVPGDVGMQNGVNPGATAGGGTERPSDGRAAGKPKPVKAGAGSAGLSGINPSAGSGEPGPTILENGPRKGAQKLTGKGNFPNSIPDHS